jgi:hypothetical protein
MRLEERLRLLRGEEAVERQPPAALAERLRRIAPQRLQHCAVETKADEQTLADALGAERLAPGVLRVERHYGLDRHARLGDCLSCLPHLMEEPAGRPSGWLFLDTETSGLAGGTGTWAFLCGLLRFEDQGLVLRQYLLARLDAERPYLEAIGSELETASLLVTYNGKSFDGPLLSTRFRLAGLSAALEGKRHLDLLAFVRRAFGRVWPDCRLATAEERLLGISREGDLPGAEVPAAWLRWLRWGETGRLAAVLRHNCWDLLSLPALAPSLKRSFADPAETGADVHSVARFHFSRGSTDLAFELLLANRDGLAHPGLLDLARLHRRRDEWSAASDIWGALAEEGLREAITAQAKYLEHRARDNLGALALARRLPPGPEREHRCRRLEAKLGTRQPDSLAGKEEKGPGSLNLQP